MSIRATTAFLATFLCGDSLPGAEPKREDTGLPGDACGVYAWPNWNPVTVNRQACPLAKGAAMICTWKSLEPQPGEFRFETQIGNRLRAAVENDYYLSLAIWTSPNEITPKWLYEAGVPRVLFPERITPFREKKHDCFPYYFDEVYLRYRDRLLERTEQYLSSLTPELRKRILFLECCEGATGDPAPYYGKKMADFWPEPLDPEYRISYEQWSRFRIETWKKYRQVFQNKVVHLPLLFKSADIRENEFAWILANVPEIGSKQALFCEYYQISGSRERLHLFRESSREIRLAGKAWFTRGEYDAQWKVCGWSTQNPAQALYWTAIYATNALLDIWQVHYEALQLEEAHRAVSFFNRYAGHRDPATAPSAFCALRWGLDAADTESFPEEIHGKANRSNIDRYLKIAADFEKYGAYQGDPDKAIGGVMRNRQCDDYNDVGWDILPGNYGRFLTQIDPDETSIGWWHKGPKESLYGRFARGFDVGAGKSAMYFRCDDGFCQADKSHKLLLRVIYLDEGTNSWTLEYDAAGGMKEAIRIANTDSGEWREETVLVDDAAMQRRGPRASDLVLSSKEGDGVFHLIEVEKRDE